MGAGWTGDGEFVWRGGVARTEVRDFSGLGVGIPDPCAAFLSREGEEGPQISRRPACRTVQVSQGALSERPSAAGRRQGLELRSDGALFAPNAAATGRRRDETGPSGDPLGMR